MLYYKFALLNNGRSYCVCLDFKAIPCVAWCLCLPYSVLSLQDVNYFVSAHSHIGNHRIWMLVHWDCSTTHPSLLMKLFSQEAEVWRTCGLWLHHSPSSFLWRATSKSPRTIVCIVCVCVFLCNTSLTALFLPFYSTASSFTSCIL